MLPCWTSCRMSPLLVWGTETGVAASANAGNATSEAKSVCRCFFIVMLLS